MMNSRMTEKLNRWKNHNLADSDLVRELDKIRTDEKAAFDCFYKDLEFGTGGLRGVIGVGTNRMNIYTVAKASQGYANYLKKEISAPSLAIAYDSRIKSEVFARTAAEVFAANGIRVSIYRNLMPTPALSFAIRYLHCSGGVVITASHNPAKYNGYKVYGCDGGQITTAVARDILDCICQLDEFDDVKRISFEDGIAEKKISFIEDDVVDAYLEAVSAQSLSDSTLDRNVSIIYTPLNGAGRYCVTRILKENGFDNITVVQEQELPDGNFPTCPNPNPELPEAMELGIKYARRTGSELLLATDPDCDRVGIAVKDGQDYTLLTGNETGMLLLDYICKRRIALENMPKHAVVFKSIVTIDMARRIAADYGVELRDVLTGFKFIGEQIGILEEQGEAERFIFGFEESYGYLSGPYVRDKDGVNAALLVCEMFAWYKSQELTLLDVLNQLYEKYGYCLNRQFNYTFEGAEGFHKMQKIMESFRHHEQSVLSGKKVLAISDYKNSVMRYKDGTSRSIDLPKSNVIKFLLEGDSALVIRPSGTEPKMKVYMSVSAKNKEEAEGLMEKMKVEVETCIYAETIFNTR